MWLSEKNVWGRGREEWKGVLGMKWENLGVSYTCIVRILGAIASAY